MQATFKLSLAAAQRITQAAMQEAQQNGWCVSIAVCDAGGHLISLERMDGAPLMSAQIAPDKARACALSGKPSKWFEDVVNNGRLAALSMPIMPLEGGEPVIHASQVIGAVGVSGVQSSQDAQIARAGIAAL